VTVTDIEEPVSAMQITADVPHSDFGEHAKKRIDYHFHQHQQILRRWWVRDRQAFERRSHM
jgi:hypothetical protein